MKLHWESENMAWGLFLQLSLESFYLCFTLAGIDIQFHIHNLRNIIYHDSETKANGKNGV